MLTDPLSEMESTVDAVLAVDVITLDDAPLRAMVLGLERMSGRLDAARAVAIAQTAGCVA